MTKTRYFLTVDWCEKGNRGIFCSKKGQAFSKDKPHTEDDFWEILDAFSMVLAPQSQALTKEQLKEYSRWIPLNEFSGEYGVALPGGKNV